MERLDGRPTFSFFLPKTDNGTLKKSSVACVFPDAHPVEGTVDEEERDDEEGRRENVGQSCAVLRGRQLHRKLDGEQTEERRELDDRVERDRRRVLERIADGVTNYGGVMERRAFV